MTTFPQYAKTNHPDVIAAVEKINQQYSDFIDKCREVSALYLNDPDHARIHGWKLDRFYLTGLDGRAVRKAGIEGWTKTNHHGYSRPKKSDPAYKNFNIGYHADSIPGRSRGNSNIIGGDGWIGVGACFIHDGAVYSGFNNRPTDPVENVQKYGWTEILASEYDAAENAYRAVDNRG